MKKSLAGWVFRLEVVTSKPGTLTRDMMPTILLVVRGIEDVEQVAIEELYESVKLFEKKKRVEARKQ